MKLYSRDTKKSMIVFGVLLSAACSLVLYISFIFAYMNNGKITVNINLYGEAVVELFLFTGCFIVIISSCFLIIDMFHKKEVVE